jgi:hypothetical protein
MSGIDAASGKIPLSRAADASQVGRHRVALVMTTASPAPPGFAVIRHADAAAVAQAGACTCCGVPSGVTRVLRQLFLDRVRGTVEFDAVIVVSSDSRALVESMADPLVAARYALVSPFAE